MSLKATLPVCTNRVPEYIFHLSLLSFSFGKGDVLECMALLRAKHTLYFIKLLHR